MDDASIEIDGEVLLRGTESERVFCSWTMGAGVYGIRKSEASFFSSELTVVDASLSRLWRQIVGKEILFQSIGSNQEVLHVSSDSDSVFLCAYEERGHPKGDGAWDADVVHISFKVPPCLGE